MIETIALDSIDSIDPSQWNALFRGEIEDWSYLRAIEHANLPGFRFVYFVVRDGDRLLAAAPAFFTDYRLDTTISGALKRITDATAKLLPRLLRMPMLGLGSPVTECCRVGFDAGSGAPQRVQWLDAIISRMETLATDTHTDMLAIKDAAATDDTLWRSVLPKHGLRALPGLPGASLTLPFADPDGYLASLGAATRKDLRRKWRAASPIDIAWRADLDSIRDEVLRLYRHTLARSEFRFEELTAAYFDNVLREMPGRAYCVTYSERGTLLAFNLVLCDGARLLDKFFGADAAARPYNLYRVSWMENIRHCIAHHIPIYESGQGLHAEKARLGSRLHANTLWYHHRNRFLDGVFARVDRLARLDRGDEHAQCA